MELNIRKIAVGDIMPVVNIINKLNFKEIAATLDTSKLLARQKAQGLTAEQRADDNIALEVGMDMIVPVVGVVLQNLPDCEKPLFSWLASMCGVPEKELRAAPPAVLPEALFEIFHQEEFGDFFKAVSKFLG